MRLNERIQIVNHNPKWKQDYADEIEGLKKKTFLSTLTYEHIGSTSIPNIKAKPVIDIIIGINSFPPEKGIIKDLEESEYTYMKEMSVLDRLYFIKRELKNFNVHIISYEGNVWNHDILFRDYMISHPDEAQEYSSLKENILSDGVETLLEYLEKKVDFIMKIYEKM